MRSIASFTTIAISQSQWQAIELQRQSMASYGYHPDTLLKTYFDQKSLGVVRENSSKTASEFELEAVESSSLSSSSSIAKYELHGYASLEGKTHTNYHRLRQTSFHAHDAGDMGENVTVVTTPSAQVQPYFRDSCGSQCIGSKSEFWKCA